MIERTLYPSCDLVIHKVLGELAEQEFAAAASALYEMVPPPRLSLWDLSEAGVTAYTLGRIQKIQSDAIDLVWGRRRGRTALIAPADFAFAVGQQYAALAASLDQPIQHQVFRSRPEAFAWLGIEDADLDDPEASTQVLAF